MTADNDHPDFESERSSALHEPLLPTETVALILKNNIDAGMTESIARLTKVTGIDREALEEAAEADNDLDLIVGLQVGNRYSKLPRSCWEIEHVAD